MPTRKTIPKRKPAQSRRRIKIAAQRRQDRDLDEGLRGTFPASDPIAANQPAPAEPEKDPDPGP